MEGDAFRAYIESQRASDESQHEDAYALAVKAHELEPDLELTILWLGLLEQRKNNFERALELYEKASKLNPHVPFASIQKCDVLIQLGREDEALVLLDAILADLPDDAAGKPRVDCLRATALHPTKPKEALELAARACAAGEKMCC
jgi:tetratricopeptide (TPR) repeat protein